MSQNKNTEVEIVRCDVFGLLNPDDTTNTCIRSDADGVKGKCSRDYRGDISSNQIGGCPYALELIKKRIDKEPGGAKLTVKSNNGDHLALYDFSNRPLIIIESGAVSNYP